MVMPLRQGTSAEHFVISSLSLAASARHLVNASRDCTFVLCSCFAVETLFRINHNCAISTFAPPVTNIIQPPPTAFYYSPFILLPHYTIMVTELHIAMVSAVHSCYFLFAVMKEILHNKSTVRNESLLKRLSVVSTRH